jgi:hypothetical protein
MVMIDVTVDPKALQMVIAAARHGPQSKALKKAIEDCQKELNASLLLAELHTDEEEV